MYYVPLSECTIAPCRSGDVIMALSSISTHKLSCIFAPIGIPKTAESKQSKIAASVASDAAICAPKMACTQIVYKPF